MNNLQMKKLTLQQDFSEKNDTSCFLLAPLNLGTNLETAIRRQWWRCSLVIHEPNLFFTKFMVEKADSQQ